MRDWLQAVALGGRTRRWLIAVGGLGLCVVVSVGWFVAAATRVAQVPVASEPAPQAPASAPQPTLVAVAVAQPTPLSTPAPSPFAGIAEPPARPPQRNGPVHHTVAAGEVLWQIAEDYGLRPETILWTNTEIADPDLLLVGQDLLIPPADGVLYTVRPGDSLADVASRYGVDIQAVIADNQLQDANQIQAGVDIFLPGGRPLASAVASDVATSANAAGEDQAVA